MDEIDDNNDIIMNENDNNNNNNSSIQKQKNEEKNSHLPWIEKYRPETLKDLVAQDDIVNTINRLIEVNRLPHLLFYGPPGTGKTSTILACARRLYGTNFKSMVMELNASDSRGIDDVREQIKGFAGTRKLFSSGVKLIILDEADNMTRDAQFALRRVIEKYTSNARFCLICNYVSKIIPALQSRCTRFRFSPLKKEHVIGRVREIVNAEKLNITDDGLDAVLRIGNGDMRKILNILQSASMAYSNIDANAVHSTTGKPTVSELDGILYSLLNDTFQQSYELLRNKQVEKGIALEDIVQEMHNYVLRLEYPPIVKANLLKDIADLDYRLASAVNHKIQLGSLIGIFQKSKILIQQGLNIESQQISKKH